MGNWWSKGWIGAALILMIVLIGWMSTLHAAAGSDGYGLSRQTGRESTGYSGRNGTPHQRHQSDDAVEWRPGTIDYYPVSDGVQAFLTGRAAIETDAVIR
jgi:hypothetical protein